MKDPRQNALTLISSALNRFRNEEIKDNEYNPCIKVQSTVQATEKPPFNDLFIEYHNEQLKKFKPNEN